MATSAPSRARRGSGDLILLRREEVAALTPEKRKLYHRYLLGYVAKHDDVPYEVWLAVVAPFAARHPLAEHHHQLWRWVYGIEAGAGSHPFVAIWNRGSGKSTTAELAAVNLGARGKRRYGVYVSATQAMADEHVASVGAILESATIAAAYPGMGDRKVGKFGSSEGWRRNRLRTASGFTIDALGLDTGARGRRVEDQRPDFIIVDDVDDVNDSDAAVEKKIRTLTQTILPFGADNAVSLWVQNVIHAKSIFARLAGIAEDDQGNPLVADFLTAREVSGPVPAVYDLEVADRGAGAWEIVGGRPSWGGMDLDECQAKIEDWGLTAFLREAQHKVSRRTGGMFDHVLPGLARIDEDEIPWDRLVRTTVWCDPAVTDTKNSDAQGVVADGIDATGTLYRLRSWEHRASPLAAVKLALAWAIEIGADHVGIETDQGGDTWQSVYREAQRDLALDVAGESDVEEVKTWAPEYAAAVLRLREAGTLRKKRLGVERSRRQRPTGPWPRYTYAKAGAGEGPKQARAQRMLAEVYETKGKVVHVRGATVPLDASLLRAFSSKPYDLLDASYWSAFYLLGRFRSKAKVTTAARQRLPTAPGT